MKLVLNNCITAVELLLKSFLIENDPDLVVDNKEDWICKGSIKPARHQRHG